MPLMTWSDALDIGEPSMNREHQEILNAMNAVFDSAEAGESGDAMMARIGLLGDVTVRHFADEERLMDRVGFPQAEVHKEVHRKMLADFAAHVEAIKADGGKPTTEFFGFLRLWLSAHIKCVDRKYADHARSMPHAA